MELTPQLPTADVLARAPAEAFSAIVAQLHTVWSVYWENPMARNRDEVLTGLPNLPRSREHPRRWAVYDVDWPSLRIFARGLERIEPSDHAWTEALAARQNLLETAEGLTLELGRLLEPWFGGQPTSWTWVATRRPRRSVYVPYWMDELRDELIEDLEDAGVGLEFPHDDRIPKSFNRVADALVRFELAAVRGLKLPNLRRLPSAVRGRPYAEFENPFWPLVHLWRLGVLCECFFLRTKPDEAVMYVHGESLVTSDAG